MKIKVQIDRTLKRHNTSYKITRWNIISKHMTHNMRMYETIHYIFIPSMSIYENFITQSLQDAIGIYTGVCFETISNIDHYRIVKWWNFNIQKCDGNLLFIEKYEMGSLWIVAVFLNSVKLNNLPLVISSISTYFLITRLESLSSAFIIYNGENNAKLISFVAIRYVIFSRLKFSSKSSELI